MRQLDLILHNATGLHARPAAVFANAAKQFQSDIRVQHGKKKVNAKSLISVLTLGVESGGRISITADGPDEETALGALETLVRSGLGEEEGPPQEKESQPQAVLAQPKEPGIQSSGHVLRGIPAAPGIAVAPLYQFRRAEIAIPETAAAPADEQVCLQRAIDAARGQLAALRAEVLERAGASEAAIFDAHLEILDDPDLLEPVLAEVNAGRSAAQAWQMTIEAKAALLAGLKDTLLAARAGDVHDVGYRVLRLMVGTSYQGPELPTTPVILVADDLSPSDTATLDSEQVLGFCTAAGGPNAHTAILARALGLPAVVGAGSDVLALTNDTQVILDGGVGTLTVEPDSRALAAAQEAQRNRDARRTAQLEVAGEPAITQDSHRMEVVANIAGVRDARQARVHGAEGVGLLRTEFLFLDRSDPPTEDEQFEAYRDIALALEGHPVIIRTLDIGGDKPLPYIDVPSEENPFLGERGIRLCLAHPELLETQVRAILRAAKFGPLRIMFPMIANLEEWQRARALVEKVRAELYAAPVEMGIMVEIPSAALLAEIFAREVNFFSIGTNDLTQYTLAIDRTHPSLSAQADGLHPAVLRLIDHTVRAAHATGKWVGVCGELAADPQAILVLVGLGVDELSVNVPAVPAVKARVRSLAFSKAQQLAAQALESATATEVRELVASA